MSDKAFTINFNSHAALVLSSGLYSDKITAVIRELACNAVDSHVAAGHPKQAILVTLPSINNPTFAVEDFGLGLSDDSVQNIYTSYFTSTKTNNSNMIGQLGLGSKSPFSLVREFFVASVFNGEYRKYRMYFDSTDTPRIKLLESFNTTKSNGVRVSFTVTSDNIDAFKWKALEVFKWFEVTPVVMLDNQQVPIENATQKLQASGWFTGKFGKFVNTKPIAVMGNIAYPLDSTSIKLITPELHGLLGLNMIVRFDLGSFEVSASRESIGYDDRSCDNIRLRLQTVLDELYSYISAKINEATTEWQARIVYESFFTSGEGTGYYLTQAMSKRRFLWKGFEIKSKTKTVNMITIYPIADSVNAIRKSDSIGNSLSRIKRNRFDRFDVDADPKHVIIFDDISRNGAARIKLWMEKNKSTYINITVFDEPNGGVTWNELTQLLGNPPVVLVSKMPAPDSKPAKTKKSQQQAMLYKPNSSSKNRAIWNDVVIDIKQGGYYVDHFERITTTSQGTKVDLNSIMRLAMTLGYIPGNIQVFRFKGYQRSRMAKLKNWINITDIITECVKRDLETIKSSLNITASKAALGKIDSIVNSPYNIFTYGWKLRDSTSLLREINDLYSEINTSCLLQQVKNISYITDLAKELHVPVESGTPDPRIAQAIKELRTRYPMLTLLNYGAWRERFDDINEYVNMVDVSWVYFELSRPTVEDDVEY